MGCFLTCLGRGNPRASSQDASRQSPSHQQQMAQVDECQAQERPAYDVDTEDVVHITMASSAIGAPLPLKKTELNWTASPPLSRSAIDRQRRVFWETAAAFGGKEEVWTALKAAIGALEEDVELARAIVQCAGIVLPTGTLTEIYDETGFRYILPNYCLEDPVNVASEDGKQPPGMKPADAKSRSFSEDPAAKTKQLRVRLSTGTDVMVDLQPTMTTFSELIKDVKKVGGISLEAGEKIVLFHNGQSLKAGMKLAELPGFSHETILQAMVFSAKR